MASKTRYEIALKQNGQIVVMLTDLSLDSAHELISSFHYNAFIRAI